MTDPHLFLPLRTVLHRRQLRKQLHPTYLDACRFFNCTLIDRTQTLETGLEFHILDPLQGLTPTPDGFDDICDQVGAEVVKQAVTSGKRVQLLWSGGIDSTTALVAIYKALERADRLDLLRVLLSQDSVQEYQRFFAEVIQKHLHYTIFTPPPLSSPQSPMSCCDG